MSVEQKQRECLYIVLDYMCVSARKHWCIVDKRVMFTCAIRCRPSVCCLSSVMLVRPTPLVEISTTFCAIWCLGHPFISTENFMEIVLGGTPLSGRGLNTRVVKYSNFSLSKAISQKRCKIGGKFVLITNRMLYMSFRLVQKSVTLNAVMAFILRYFTEFGSFRGALHKSG